MKSKFNKQRMNKRASVIYAPLLGLMLLIVLSILFANIIKEHEKFEADPMGEKQFSLLKTHATAIHAIDYLEMVSPYVFQLARDEVANSGGLKYHSCGTYRGSPVLDVENEDCFPLGETLDEAFTDAFNNNMNDYLFNYKPIYLPRDNFEVEVIANDVKVTPIKPLNFQIISTSSTVLFEPVEGDWIDRPREYATTVSPGLRLVGSSGSMTVDSHDIAELDALIVNVMNSGGSYTAVELVETLGFTYYPGSVNTVVSRYKDRIIYYANLYGVPAEDMVGLISQESGGDPEIGSSTGCWGLGQFCGPTAYDYGLCDEIVMVSNKKEYCVYQDDRNDPEKSMDAIARYLKVLLARYSEYKYQNYFAHADYNAGAGVVLDVIEEAKLEYSTDDPTWLEVASMVGSEDIIEHYSWVTDDNEKDLIYSVEKALEVKKHAPRVMAYKQVYEGD